MFDSVSFVRNVCKEKGISVSSLEKQCGFSNGYLNPKKMQKIPYDRALKISKVLGITVEEIMGQKEKLPADEDQELNELLERLKNRKECRMLFQLAKDATKEDVEQAVKIIEALRK